MRQLIAYWLQTPKTLRVIGTALLALMWMAGASTATAQSATNSASNATQAESAEDDGRMTYDEILALFQREARAAYQMNRQACEGMAAEDLKKCLAAARLQFDQDLRYAQRRADQGY